MDPGTDSSENPPQTKSPFTFHHWWAVAFVIIVILVIPAIILNFLVNQTPPSPTPTPKDHPNLTPIPSPTPTAPSQVDPTSNWKTYTNQLLNFEVKLPIDIEAIEQDSASVGLGTFPPNPEPYLIFTKKLNNYLKYDSTPITLDGVNFTRFIVNDQPHQHIIIQSKQPQLEIQWKPQYTDDYSTFDQILSTFRFLDQEESRTDSWQTYTNEDYQFSIRYPSELFITENSTNQSSLFFPDKSLIKISNQSGFENKETALVISFSLYETDPSRPPWANQPSSVTKDILNTIGYDQLSTQFKSQVAGDFFGNPPWGYYRLFLPLPDPEHTIQVDIRIHQSDDPVYGGKNQDLQLAKQILSTYRFTE